MNKITKMFLLSAAVIGIASCKKEVSGEGPSISQVRTIPNFTGIDLEMAGEVYYNAGTAPKLEIVAQQNILDILETFVSDNKLVLKFNGNHDYHSSDAIRINVSGVGVNYFGLNTAGSIHCITSVRESALSLSVKGSGSIMMQNVVAHSIEATNSGSGNITAISGSSVTEHLKTSGSGRIDLMGIAAVSVTAKVSGSGNIRVNASDQLNATIEGSGCIYFTGYPNVSSHISGSGHLIHF